MYASTIWRPIGKINMDRLERIQHKAIRHLAFLSGNPLSRFDHDYACTAETFCLPSVSSSMIGPEVLFLYKIKSNQVKCSELQNLFPIHNSNYILRNKLSFYPEIHLAVGTLKKILYSDKVNVTIIGPNDWKTLWISH